MNITLLKIEMVKLLLFLLLIVFTDYLLIVFSLINCITKK